MRLASLTSGQPFKVALRALLVFLAVYVVASAVLLRSVENSLSDELSAQTEAEMVLLHEIYRSEGRAGLVNALEQMERAVRAPERVAGLFDAQGLSLTGPISLMPDFVGIRRHEIGALTRTRIGGVYVLNARKVERMTLVVGRNGAPIQRARERLIWGLSLFGVVVGGAILAIGLWASQTSLKRLKEMENALARVSGGDMEARLPVHRRNDQFDRVSVRVNQNLNQLSRLVSGVKTTASAIAHDLKTPLSHTQIALHQAADAAEAGKDPIPAIEAALSELENLNGIFDTMLRISRIQANTGQTGFEPVNLSEVVENAIEFMRPLAEEREQDLLVDTADKVGWVDATMVQQALVNLLKNAVDHAGAGAEIRISLQDGQDRLEITVEDNGPGIPAVELDHVLEPFVRLDSARTEPGSGLGLALVQAVAEHHGGKLILLDAAPGLRATLQLSNFKKD